MSNIIEIDAETIEGNLDGVSTPRDIFLRALEFGHVPHTWPCNIHVGTVRVVGPDEPSISRRCAAILGDGERCANYIPQDRLRLNPETRFCCGDHVEAPLFAGRAFEEA